MKKVKVIVANNGSEVKFTNNGRVTEAPKGVVIKGFVAEAAVKINNSCIVSINYKIGIKNPVDGKIIWKTIPDVELTLSSTVECEMTMPYEVGEFLSKDGNLINGTVLGIFNKNIFNKLSKENFEVIDEYSVYHQDLTEGSEIVWGA